MALVFDNTYARLPEHFHARQQPMRMPAPALVLLNEPLARSLGLDPAHHSRDALAAMLSGNALPEGAEPVAMVYAGHQFGSWVPRLGDGRALLLGEVLDDRGRRLDIHLKGAGPTPFSRGGDGRAALGPVLREYIVSEAMARLGIPTTRSLAALTTGDRVARETPLPGAILVRVAESHLRVGTFQYFAARRDTEALRQLADYAIARLYPEAAQAPERYKAFLEAVIARQARLVARWMGVGFIHGVMNTDNTSIAGETLDYGPCAFMDAFDLGAVFSSIDAAGRYAYGNQPGIVYWNLARLAQALLPLLAPDPDAAAREAQAAIDLFPGLYETAWLEEMRRKLGLSAPDDGDGQLVRDLFSIMHDHGADFTLTFRRLADAVAAPGSANDPALEPGFEPWLARWRARLQREGADAAAARQAMNRANPLYIPRNHLVEAALEAAHADDYAPLHALIAILAEPFDEQPNAAEYALPPRPEQIVRATFCGT